MKKILKPLIISHGADDEGFASKFIWDGTRDYSAQLSVYFLTRFWREAIKYEEALKYASNLNYLAQKLLEK